MPPTIGVRRRALTTVRFVFEGGNQPLIAAKRGIGRGTESGGYLIIFFPSFLK
jgi:hypothetical protein